MGKAKRDGTHELVAAVRELTKAVKAGEKARAFRATPPEDVCKECRKAIGTEHIHGHCRALGGVSREVFCKACAPVVAARAAPVVAWYRARKARRGQKQFKAGPWELKYRVEGAPVLSDGEIAKLMPGGLYTQMLGM